MSALPPSQWFRPRPYLGPWLIRSHRTVEEVDAGKPARDGAA